MNCFYVHPAGRVVDEDPAKGRCKFGETCTNPSCFYTHPDTRKPVNQMFCYFCKEQGHMRKDCPKCPQGNAGKVVMGNFPEEWGALDSEAIVGKITAELEVFGTLTSPVEMSDQGKKATAIFADTQLAKQAIEALNLTVFEIALDPASQAAARSSENFGRDKRCTVFVGNIPYDATEDQLKEVFSRVGIVEDLRLVYDRDTKQPKGYGFCEYQDPEIAKDAVKFLHDVELNGRRMRVTSAENTLKSRGDIFGGERRSQDSSKDGEECKLKLEGFPRRWTSNDVRDFFQGAVKSKSAMLNIEMAALDDDATTGQAIVTFGSTVEAKRAKSDLHGQKIAGKPLSVSFDGADGADSEDEQADGDWWRKRDGGNRRRDDNWRKDDDWWGRDQDWKRDDDRRDRRDDDKTRDKPLLVTMHIDELAMPQRPSLEPSPEDVEVWVDPLPEEGELQDWLASFGEVDEVFRVPDLDTGKPGDRGYVRFKAHSAAIKCIEAGAGTWSESERTLSSQLARHGGRSSAYPESIVGKILGTRGGEITAIKDEIGASLLSLRGEGLGEHEKMASKRVHFVCKGTPEAVSKLQPALERLVKKIHEEVQEKLTDPGYMKRIQAQRARSRSARRREPHRDRDRDRDRDLSREASNDATPWRPPAGDPMARPPAWGHWPPPGAPPPYGWQPPPGPDGYGWRPPPPGMGAAWGAPWAPPESGPWHPQPSWDPRAGPPPPGGPGPPPPGGPGPPPSGPPGAPAAPAEEADAAARGSSRKRRRRREGEGGAAEGQGRDRDRRRARRGEEGEEGTAGAEAAGEGHRKRRRERGPGAAPAGDPAGPPPPGSAGGGGAEAPPQGPAETPGWSAVGYLEKLPRELTEQECRLADAVDAFMQNWRETHEEGSRPNLVHLGANAHIRDCKALALPREVSLKVWLKHRLGDKVDVIGQSVVLVDPPAR